MSGNENITGRTAQGISRRSLIRTAATAGLAVAGAGAFADVLAGPAQAAEEQRQSGRAGAKHALGGISPEFEAISVTSWGPGRLDIFVIGPSNHLYHKAWDGSAWLPSQSGFENLGGTCASPPTVVSWGPHRLDIFVIGTDARLHHKAWDGSRWLPSATGFDDLGGNFWSPPAVASWGAGRLDIFVTDPGARLNHKAWEGSRWLPSATGFDDLGGNYLSPPAVASWAPDRLDIFMTDPGNANHLYHKAWDGLAWLPSPSGFENLGGTCTSPPAVASWAPDRLDIFVTGPGNHLYHKAWDGSAWLPSPSGFENLGGDVRLLPIPPVGTYNF